MIQRGPEGQIEKFIGINSGFPGLSLKLKIGL